MPVHTINTHTHTHKIITYVKRVFITGKTKQRHLREARMLSETGGGEYDSSK